VYEYGITRSKGRWCFYYDVEDYLVLIYIYRLFGHRWWFLFKCIIFLLCPHRCLFLLKSRICIIFSIFPKEWPYSRRCWENFELLLFFKTNRRLLDFFISFHLVWPTCFSRQSQEFDVTCHNSLNFIVKVWSWKKKERFFTS